jgi:putative transposase
MLTLPLQFLALALAGWMTRDQRLVTEYLLAENTALREQLRGRRIRYTAAQRRRLAVAAKKLGRKALVSMDTLVTPATLLRWYRRLAAEKYDGSTRRGTARPRRTPEIVENRFVSSKSRWMIADARDPHPTAVHTALRSPTP